MKLEEFRSARPSKDPRAARHRAGVTISAVGWGDAAHAKLTSGVRDG